VLEFGNALETSLLSAIFDYTLESSQFLDMTFTFEVSAETVKLTSGEPRWRDEQLH
jgi:hypothetical protein